MKIFRSNWAVVTITGTLAVTILAVAIVVNAYFEFVLGSVWIENEANGDIVVEIAEWNVTTAPESYREVSTGERVRYWYHTGDRVLIFREAGSDCEGLELYLGIAGGTFDGRISIVRFGPAPCEVELDNSLLEFTQTQSN